MKPFSPQFIQGVCFTGAWLCLRSVNLLSAATLSALAPSLSDLSVALAELQETGEARKADVLLAERTKVDVCRGGFVCFTSSGRQGWSAIPRNLRVSPIKTSAGRLLIRIISFRDFCERSASLSRI